MAITLSERAATHVENYLRTEAETHGLRLGVKTTGCSGYMYVVQSADAIDAADTVFESRGINVVIDEKSLKFLDGTHIDFGRNGLNEGFQFENPNVEETCGCGESFSLVGEGLPSIEAIN
jgi:iron-sulfur cluster assembly protein